MTSMLEDVIAHGTGYPNAVIGRPAAGKTGTTSSFRDAWFVGYTPDLVVAVWLGNDDYSPMNESYGGNVPARIWAKFMKAALAATPPHEFAFPAEEVAKVAGCRRGYEYFLKGTEPQSGCGGSIDETEPDDVQPAAAGLVEPPQPPVQATPTPLVPPTAQAPPSDEP
jgi:penicillin-binding protein 1A